MSKVKRTKIMSEVQMHEQGTNNEITEAVNEEEESVMNESRYDAMLVVNNNGTISLNNGGVGNTGGDNSSLLKGSMIKQSMAGLSSLSAGVMSQKNGHGNNKDKASVLANQSSNAPTDSP